VTGLGSPVRAQPLFLEQWTVRRGSYAGQTFNLVLIATSDNMIRAYAEEQLLQGNQNPLWSTSLGRPAQDGCSNIPPPIGICGTPVVDFEGRRLFVVALIDDGSESQHCTDNNGQVHTYGQLTYFIFALDVDTFAIEDRAPLHDPGAIGCPTFNANRQD
jgi:hypothetical protein